MNLLKKQKYMLLLFIFLINLLLMTTFLVYPDKWYVFICFLAFASIINASSVVLVLVYKMFDKPVGDRMQGKNYIYDDNGILKRIEIYKNGGYVGDAQIED